MLFGNSGIQKHVRGTPIILHFLTVFDTLEFKKNHLIYLNSDKIVNEKLEQKLVRNNLFIFLLPCTLTFFTLYFLFLLCAFFQCIFTINNW